MKVREIENIEREEKKITLRKKKTKNKNKEEEYFIIYLELS